MRDTSVGTRRNGCIHVFLALMADGGIDEFEPGPGPGRA
jgi:hypothetical protein